jgi:hypothetical protein
MVGRGKLRDIRWPEFGSPEVMPRITASEYEERLDKARAKMAEKGLTHLVVYADREHSANMAYLTGYDPRFEEALLVLGRRGKPLILVGNEGLGYVPVSPVKLEVELFQSFSLPGQDRSKSRKLPSILSGYGIGKASKAGTIGWKYFGIEETKAPDLCLEIPSYIADILRELTGSRERVVNATAIFQNPSDGLRLISSADQIALFEFAATRTSEGMKRLIWGLKPGMREYEVVRFYQADGLPLSCHLIASSGEKAKKMGLSSPSDNIIRLGDPFITGFGLWGALNARAGFVAASEADLPKKQKHFIEDFASPYFSAVCKWYETIGIGVRAGDVVKAVTKFIPKNKWDLALNPGHYIHLDEWVSSSFYPSSKIRLRSGMAFQMDMIPVSKGPFYLANMEDGIVLADRKLRDEISQKHPDCWGRIQKRRDFMMSTIGIELKSEVLPLCNIPGIYAPFFLSPGKVFVN